MNTTKKMFHVHTPYSLIFVTLRFPEPWCLLPCSWYCWKDLDKQGCTKLVSYFLDPKVKKKLNIKKILTKIHLNQNQKL